MTSIDAISRPVKYGLYFAASWPEMPFAVLHKFCWLFILGAAQVLQYSYVIIHYKTDTLPDIVNSLSISMPFSMLTIKLFVVWTNRGVLRDILRTMEEECQKYAAIDTKNLISKTAHLSYRLTTAVLCVCVTSTAFYAIGSFVTHETNVTMDRQHLLRMYLPFEARYSPIYELVVAGQYVYQASSAFTFGVFTALLLMVVLHVGCQIDIMCRTLLEVPYKTSEQLKCFIRRHQEIIVLAERIEKLFTYIALSQLLLDTLITCCVGYLMVTALRTDNGYIVLIKCILFYIGICLEAFIYCFAGEYLNIKSKLISDTAYEFLWYNLQPNESRLLTLIILRSQKGFTFTFGKFANLSLGSFTAIMKASGSFVSVLLAMS